MPIPPRTESAATSTADASVITVELGDRSYPIAINSGETGLADQAGFAGHAQAALGDCTHAIIIQDKAVADSAGVKIAKSLKQIDLRVSVIEVASGETSKSTDRIAKLWNEMLDTAADRRSVVIAVGGGVIGDLAGFAAATFTRGLRLVQVPTTLLAMVDSSVGGKTGINLPGGKNLVGAFWQPHLVWIDTDFLNTLPEREYISGLAEVIKYGVIEDAEFFEYLETDMAGILQRDPVPTRHAIAKSCQSKARVVAEDERETTGRRAILNYGHTFAHAIESTAGYGVMLHGEAVAIGMQMAANLSINLGRCDEQLLERQTELLAAAKLPLTWKDADPNDMIAVMARDKKVAHGKLRFVLPDRIGNVELVGDVPAPQVVAAIKACR
ncbi:3-dehydroquinate synthase [Aporhodopirellula aestuarii]|uniref:3-dehydroquinate synthase n=1 Tax=Aporhodopirellula aestuarii TaxID=2950107 RepID=A0ABT0U4J0_9BACT|nr:3-dehydroquinate synthase [Aporhodopirellula aestuarii]MCM2371470.1 3-dehydroquinate synthase [Aporhodopirellula aestuarii]